MKPYRALGGVLVLGALLAYLLWPLGSSRLDINWDTRALEEKKSILARAQALPQPQGQRPNIVLILADDLGKTDISLYGGPVPTPHIESLALDGVFFSDAYASSPICSPSRASLLTGRYQQRFGYETQPMERYPRNRLEFFFFKHLMDLGDWVVRERPEVPLADSRRRQGLPPSEITIADLLQAAGYSTAMVGKWHLGHDEDLVPIRRGFQHQYGFYGAFSLYSPVGAEGILEHRHDYFANRHIWKMERSGSSAIRRSGVVVEEADYLTYAITREAQKFILGNHDQSFFLFVSFNAPHTPFQAPRHYVERFAHVQDPNKSIYYAMIAALDDAVGGIVGTLDALGLGQRTLVVFASDNGGATYTGATDNAPLRGGKFTHFQGGINIPMAMRLPGVIPSGSRCSQAVSLMDLLPTFAGLAEVPLPGDREMDGVDLLPVVKGAGSRSLDRALFWRNHHQKAVRRGPWKLFVDESQGITQLFDLGSDVSESRDLSAQQPGLVRSLQDELELWEGEMKEPAWPYVMSYRVSAGGREFLFPL